MKKSFEVRLHGRGGQGGVTCAKILASVYAHMGRSVQTFGDYAGERSGAPVRAYTRVSDEKITNRNKVYEPDELLVLDDSLLGADVLEGLVPGGCLLVNTDLSIEELDARFGDAFAPFALAVIDATAIARSHGIGSRSVVIVNTTIAGAYAKVHGVELGVLEAAYKDLGLSSNLEAAKEAYGLVAERAPLVEREEADRVAAPLPMDGDLPPVDELVEHKESAPTGLATGSWSSQRPVYVENLAPCNAFCPAGNDVVGFVQASGKLGREAAAAVLAHSTPLPGTCGRVCPAPCMEGCNRVELDGAVNIRGLERLVADHAEPAPFEAPEPAGGARRLAVVGGGPAGLAAAFEARKLGHEVTIFEGEEHLGGVLRTGIPTYRLPREVLDREVNAVLAMGVKAEAGVFLDASGLERLAEDFDAVVIATGLQKLRGLDVPGADLRGVQQGIHFLHEQNLGAPGKLSGHVVVLGGGNTAMDCARSALRSGAESVTVAYRRTVKEMPAITEEIGEALAEGVKFAYLRAPVGFEGVDGRVSAVRLAEVRLGEPDSDGRRRPVVTKKTSTLPCDHVLLALGQSADTGFLPADWSLVRDAAKEGVELERGRVHRAGKELNVFGAGDLATGEGTVTHAIGSGRRAAGLALAYLDALPRDMQPFTRPDKRAAISAARMHLDHFKRAPQNRGRSLPPELATASFDEVNGGLEGEAEWNRCFSCGHCTECDTCLVYCPEGIIERSTDSPYAVDSEYCKGCGICVAECPRGAMEMTTL